MSSKMYDLLKWISLVLLPAIAAAYFGLGQIWELPEVERVVGTMTILDTFLGLILSKSSKDYQKKTDNPILMGDLVVVQEIDGHPATVRIEPREKTPIFQDGKLAAFRVKRETLE